MKNLPRDIQAMIIGTLDPKSVARLRTVSKELKNVVDTSRPPTGSYEKKTGRFQKRFSEKHLDQCVRKQEKRLAETGMLHHMRVEYYGFLNYKRMKAAYAKNTLLRVFKEISSSQTEDEFMHEMMRLLKCKEIDMNEWRNAWMEDNRQRKIFRRRVVRLLKAWSKTNATYVDTLMLVRKRNHLYTAAEEKAHKDRLMDAIIVQIAAAHKFDDPTRTILDSRGVPLTLDEKINAIVKKCTTCLKIE
jgi:hypothetical protein